MMEIRMRHEQDAKAVPFTRGGIEDIDRLIKWLRRSG